MTSLSADGCRTPEAAGWTVFRRHIAWTSGWMRSQACWPMMCAPTSSRVLGSATTNPESRLYVWLMRVTGNTRRRCNCRLTRMSGRAAHMSSVRALLIRPEHPLRLKRSPTPPGVGSRSVVGAPVRDWIAECQAQWMDSPEHAAMMPQAAGELESSTGPQQLTFELEAALLSVNWYYHLYHDPAYLERAPPVRDRLASQPPERACARCRRTNKPSQQRYIRLTRFTFGRVVGSVTLPEAARGDQPGALLIMKEQQGAGDRADRRLGLRLARSVTFRVPRRLATLRL